MVSPCDLIVEGTLESEVHLYFRLLKVAHLTNLVWLMNMLIGLHLESMRAKLELAYRDIE